MTPIERRAIKFDRSPTFYGCDGVFGMTLNNHRIIKRTTLKDTQYIYLGLSHKSRRPLYIECLKMTHVTALCHTTLQKFLRYHADGSFNKPQRNVFSRIASCLCSSSKHVGDSMVSEKGPLSKKNLLRRIYIQFHFPLLLKNDLENSF